MSVSSSRPKVSIVDPASPTHALVPDASGQIGVNNFPATQPVSGTLSVNATAETSQISNAGTQLTPKFAKIVASASGATTIVAAVTSKKIRVLAMKLTANAAVNVKWQSHVTPTDLTGLDYLAANGGYVMPANQFGWFETVAGEALDINLSAAVAVGGNLVYVEV